MANIGQMKNRQAREKAFHSRFYDLFGKGKTLALGRSAIARMNIIPGVSESAHRETLNHFAEYGFVRFEQNDSNQPSSTLLMDRKSSWQELEHQHELELAHAIEAGKAASISSLPAANAARTARKEAKQAARAENVARRGETARQTEERHLAEFNAKPAAKAAIQPNETIAIVGDEPEAPMSALRPARKLDDADALIEAARQYANREKQINEKLDELRRVASELGVELTANVILERDERLETVALILPTIDGMAKRITRLEAEVTQNRDISRQAVQLRLDNEALRRQNQRIIAQKTMNNGEAVSA